MLKIKKNIELIDQHNPRGFYLNKFGGNFVAETAIKPIDDFLIGQAYGQEYVNAFYVSKFCLVVRGRTVWTRRFTEVFQYNCIPVIVSDGYLPPFSNVFDWTSFSLRIAESDIFKLPQILENVSEKIWYKMQSQMDIVKHHFLYNDPPKIGDAFYIALYEIWLKVRKFRRRV